MERDPERDLERDLERDRANVEQEHLGLQEEDLTGSNVAHATPRRTDGPRKVKVGSES